MQQMLRRLVQRFLKYIQHLFGIKQTRSTREVQTARKLPELTNSDLEFLFTQLLEGVNQARGQHWAQRWLQNLEHRVSQQRWLEWLQYFGNKLLASVAPNHELASRMVDLGELEIGEIGDVAYDIGVQLLTRNAKQQPAYSIPISTEFERLTSTPESQQFLIEPVATNGEREFDVESEQTIVESIATNGEFDTVVSLEDSPGQNLIREFGELLWENYEPNSNAIAPANTGTNRIHAPLDDFSEALYEQVFEYEESDESVETPENTDTAAFEELSNIPEQVQEVTPGEDLIRNLGELLWEEETLRSDRHVNASEQEFINDLSDLVWDYPEQNQEDIADELDTTFAPIQDSAEDAEETFNALLELAEEVEADEPETEVVEPTSVEPTVTAIDQLLVRLDESASLVEELASGLGERRSAILPLSLTDRVVEDESAAQAAEAWFYQGLS